MKSQSGITIFELLIALVVAAILATIAAPLFGKSGPDCDNPNARQGPLMRARIAQVTSDIGNIHIAASKFELSNNRYPANLAEVGLDNLRDPWGNPYQYLVVFGLTNVGPVRKDHNLKPVNTGYDVYSMGPDGVTATPFTSTLGKDDIVMANDGDYFGLACQYNGSGKN
ncbi:MAG TPA: prepilin-type N-terminal cleavage/methylation domain-containing protein [Woeseiaceae bacterium]|jgi:general secretion pathway protein G